MITIDLCPPQAFPYITTLIWVKLIIQLFTVLGLRFQ